VRLSARPIAKLLGIGTATVHRVKAQVLGLDPLLRK
jgi:hypothetical protein